MRTVMELIPGLPDDLALECLMRVSVDRFPTAASVCKAWKATIETLEFRRRRKEAALARFLVVLAQAWVDPSWNPRSTKLWSPPLYRLTLCDPETGNWSELPPLPWFPAGLPMFCQMVGVGSDLVVMGGCDPMTWQVCNSVFIYDFVSGSWRCGADMPGRQRLFFACASDSDQMVYVAGGHDEEKNALKSAMAYDVAKDKWIRLPDMARARDECKGVFKRGKFHVIGGYDTDWQGCFETHAEAFDHATRTWDSVQDSFLDAATCPASCVGVNDVQMYMCSKGKVMSRLDGASWEVQAGLPAEVAMVAYVTAWQGNLLVIGRADEDGPHSAYLMDLKDHKWTKVEAPGEYKGHVQAGCCLQI